MKLWCNDNDGGIPVPATFNGTQRGLELNPFLHTENPANNPFSCVMANKLFAFRSYTDGRKERLEVMQNKPSCIITVRHN